MTYVVFKRTANNWKQFASASKIKVKTRCAHAEAVRLCKYRNDQRSAGQRRRGTVFEFMGTDAWNDMKGKRDA